MSYKSLSLCLLLSSSVAMAMETTGAGQASAPGQTTQETKKSEISNEFDELKKLFPENRLYLITEHDKIRGGGWRKLDNDYIKRYCLSAQQAAHLTDQFGRLCTICFHPGALGTDDWSMIKSYDARKEGCWYIGALIPNSKYVCLVEKDYEGCKNAQTGERVTVESFPPAGDDRSWWWRLWQDKIMHMNRDFCKPRWGLDFERC